MSEESFNRPSLPEISQGPDNLTTAVLVSYLANTFGLDEIGYFSSAGPDRIADYIACQAYQRDEHGPLVGALIFTALLDGAQERPIIADWPRAIMHKVGSKASLKEIEPPYRQENPQLTRAENMAHIVAAALTVAELQSTSQKADSQNTEQSDAGAMGFIQSNLLETSYTDKHPLRAELYFYALALMIDSDDINVEVGARFMQTLARRAIFKYGNYRHDTHTEEYIEAHDMLTIGLGLIAQKDPNLACAILQDREISQTIIKTLGDGLQIKAPSYRGESLQLRRELLTSSPFLDGASLTPLLLSSNSIEGFLDVSNIENEKTKKAAIAERLTTVAYLYDWLRSQEDPESSSQLSGFLAGIAPHLDLIDDWSIMNHIQDISTRSRVYALGIAALDQNANMAPPPLIESAVTALEIYDVLFSPSTEEPDKIDYANLSCIYILKRLCRDADRNILANMTNYPQLYQFLLHTQARDKQDTTPGRLAHFPEAINIIRTLFPPAPDGTMNPAIPEIIMAHADEEGDAIDLLQHVIGDTDEKRATKIVEDWIKEAEVSFVERIADIIRFMNEGTATPTLIIQREKIPSLADPDVILNVQAETILTWLKEQDQITQAQAELASAAIAQYPDATISREAAEKILLASTRQPRHVQDALIKAYRRNKVDASQTDPRCFNSPEGSLMYLEYLVFNLTANNFATVRPWIEAAINSINTRSASWWSSEDIKNIGDLHQAMQEKPIFANLLKNHSLNPPKTDA